MHTLLRSVLAGLSLLCTIGVFKWDAARGALTAARGRVGLALLVIGVRLP